MIDTAILAAKQTQHRAWHFLLIVVPVIAWMAFPASYWFDVERVYVHDAVEGTTPLMEVDRVIRHPFRAEWTATVLRQVGEGFTTYCTAHGGNDYDPDAELPDSIDLNWWTWPVECKLPSGSYMLKTLWILHLPLMPDKQVRIRSNVFAITEP